VVLTKQYQRLAADYFCLGYYWRYTMMTSRERTLKRGACLSGQWPLGDGKLRRARSEAFLFAPLTILLTQQGNSVV
jgi:hypothetical protein